METPDQCGGFDSSAAATTAAGQAGPYAVGGCYHIRSLYFDTPSDKALREKLDGVNGREKFRIRCYNRDFSLIHLEKKSKRNGLGRKEKVRLTPDQVQALMNGETNCFIPN